MTIYRLYTQNGDRAGFFVQHRTWTNLCARVQSVAGQRMGRLPGVPPTHDFPEVVLQTFDVRSGRPVGTGAPQEEPGDRNYSLIAEPSWFHQAALHETLPPRI